MSLQEQNLVGAAITRHRVRGDTHGTVNLIAEDSEKVHLIWAELGGDTFIQDLPLLEWSCETLPSGQVELKRKQLPEKRQTEPWNYDRGFTIVP